MKKVLKLNKGWDRPRGVETRRTQISRKQIQLVLNGHHYRWGNATAELHAPATLILIVFICVCVCLLLCLHLRWRLFFFFGFVLGSRLGGFHPQEGNFLSVGNNFRFAMEHCTMVKRSICMKSFLSLILSNSFILFLSRVRWFSG